MKSNLLPSSDEMRRAFTRRDAAYDGVFYTAVHTTGIFCRPSCPARKPRPENIAFYARAEEAVRAGFRPCRRCRPLETAGAPPPWLRELLAAVEADPNRRWSEAELRTRGFHPDRVRRWFLANYGVTFQGYRRARSLGQALGRIRQGSEVLSTALDHGYESLSGFNDAFRRRFGTSPTEARNMSVITVTRFLTPLGPMVAGATERGLCLLEFVDRRMLETQLGRIQKRFKAALVPGTHPLLKQAGAELEAYFRGTQRKFEVPLEAAGTPFQEKVWKELRKIPYGRTISYAELARRIGEPTAQRAVAHANGDNRMAIIIPCHRVIGSDGKLTGYGGGLWRKQRLLDLEQGRLELGLGAATMAGVK